MVLYGWATSVASECLHHRLLDTPPLPPLVLRVSVSSPASSENVCGAQIIDSCIIISLLFSVLCTVVVVDIASVVFRV